MHRSALTWIEIGLSVFDCVGLDWIGCQWIGVDWSGLAWIGMDWGGLEWIGMAWNGSQWIALDWSGLLILGMIKIVWPGFQTIVDNL